MSAPNCPVHGRPMRESTKGQRGFYCTAKLADGSYCRERTAAIAAPAQQAPVQAPAPANGGAAELPDMGSGNIRLAAMTVAVESAARFYAGAGVAESTISGLAKRLYAELLAAYEGR